MQRAGRFTQQAATILRRYQELWNSAALTELLNGFSDDIVVEFADLPRIKGKAELERILRARLARQKGYRLEKTLRAVIAEGGINLQSMKVVRMLGKGASTVRRSMDALMDRGILREEEHSGAVRMRFEDAFFSHWTRMFTAKL